MLALAGAWSGMAAALGYGALILYGLRTWWVDAVGTRLLSLHASAPCVVVGRVGGRWSPAWAPSPGRCAACRPRRRAGCWRASEKVGPSRLAAAHRAVAVLIAAALLAAAWRGRLDQTAGFFGAGALLLTAALLLESAWLRSRGFAAIGGQVTLGLRSASYRPGRSILCIALIASATFLIVSLDAFQREGSSAGAAAIR